MYESLGPRWVLAVSLLATLGVILVVELREDTMTIALPAHAAIADDEDRSSAIPGRMRLFAPRASLNKPVSIYCYIRPSFPFQRVSLVLPDGMVLVPGSRATQFVPLPNSNGYAAVTWKVQILREGTYYPRVEAPGIGEVSERVRTFSGGIFD